MSALAETRKFSIHPDIIFSLIRAQAGSLGKALAECVMNSIDAFATRVDIRFDTHTLEVRDNGQGFRDRDEVLTWFEVLGFPHDEGNHRRFGKFGMGRAQLWSFASTVWRTNDFELDVDIKRRGLDYELRELGSPVSGLVIDGRFYEPLGLHAQKHLVDELKALVRFAPAEVYLNGARISFDPAGESWTTETTEAWMSLQAQRSGTLVVYNQGVLVNQFPYYRYKVTGVVCTKPGQPLALNMARNAILESECKVWARIRRSFPEQPERAKRVERPSNRELHGRLEPLLAKPAPTENDLTELLRVETLTDVAGRWSTLDARLRFNALPVFTAAPKGSALGKLAQQRKLAYVLDEQALERFGVNSVGALGKALREFVERAVKDGGVDEKAWWVRQARDALASIRWVDSVAEAIPELAHDCEVLDTKSLGEVEQGVRTALAQMLGALRQLLRQVAPADSVWAASPYERGRREYDLHIGKSPTRQAWTDGVSRIVLECRTVGTLARQGLGGFCVLVQLVLGEMLYEQSTITRETHGPAEAALLAQLARDPRTFNVALAACYRFARTSKDNSRRTKLLLRDLDSLVSVDATASASAGATAVASGATSPVATAL